jgi:hypothetical protein
MSFSQKTASPPASRSVRYPSEESRQTTTLPQRVAFDLPEQMGQAPQPYIIVPYPQYASMIQKPTGSPAAEGVRNAAFFSISIAVKMPGQEPESCTTYVPMEGNRDLYRVYKEIFDFINAFKSQHPDSRSRAILKNELDNITFNLDVNTLSIVSQTSGGVVKYVSDRSKLNMSDVVKKLIEHVQETNVNAATSKYVIPACSVKLTDCFTSRINLDDKTLEELFTRVLENPKLLFLGCS